MFLSYRYVEISTVVVILHSCASLGIISGLYVVEIPYHEVQDFNSAI
jgi:hypothetical protein